MYAYGNINLISLDSDITRLSLEAVVDSKTLESEGGVLPVFCLNTLKYAL